MLFLDITLSNRTMTILGMLTGVAITLIVLFIANYFLNKRIKKNKAFKS